MLWIIGGLALVLFILLRPAAEDARYQNLQRGYYRNACKYCRISTEPEPDPDAKYYLIKD